MTAVALQPVAALLAVLAAAVMLRVGVGGDVAGSDATAGCVFMLVLAAAVVVRKTTRARTDIRTVAIGVACAAVVVVPALARVGVHGTLPVAGYPRWAALTTAIAFTEEAFLRGALFDAVMSWRGRDAAIVLAAISFALMHVPFYGWSAVPVDLAVGIVLGLARVLSGTWVAPAIGHTVADLAGWWFV